jgi:DNA invertase Pin-like site-specific DNA recombinase
VNPSPPSGRRVGYARVSTDDQNLSLQLDALAQHGVSADLIFTGKLSGAKDDRPGLARCLKALKAGDTLVDAGVTLDDICATLHISRTTYYRYVRAGRKAARGRLAVAGQPPDGTAATGLPAPVVDTRQPAG